MDYQWAHIHRTPSPLHHSSELTSKLRLRRVILRSGDFTITHWNNEFRRLERSVRLDSGTVRNKSVADSVFRAATGEVMFGRGPATTRLRASLSGVPGDSIIALSDTDLISFMCGRLLQVILIFVPGSGIS